MFRNLVATIIGLLVVVIAGSFVTIINPLVGIPFILCGIFLLIFPNFLSNKVLNFARDKETTEHSSPDSAPAVPRIETYKLSNTELYTDVIRSLGTPNPEYDLSREEIIAHHIGGENLYPLLFEAESAVLKDSGEEVSVLIQEQQVGTIGRNNRERVRRLLTESRIDHSTVKITGGPHRILSAEDGEIHEYDDPYSVRLEITIRDKETGKDDQS